MAQRERKTPAAAPLAWANAARPPDRSGQRRPEMIERAKADTGQDVRY